MKQIIFASAIALTASVSAYADTPPVSGFLSTHQVGQYCTWIKFASTPAIFYVIETGVPNYGKQSDELLSGYRAHDFVTIYTDGSVSTRCDQPNGLNILGVALEPHPASR